MAAGKKILVVDDDPDIREYCKTVLEAKGYTVTCIADAKTAQAAIQKEGPDLVVMDVMMEEMDSGFVLAQALRKEFPKLPMLILSSIADASAQSFDTTTLPVSELIQKPIKPDMLVAKVKRLVG